MLSEFCYSIVFTVEAGVSADDAPVVRRKERFSLPDVFVFSLASGKRRYQTSEPRLEINPDCGDSQVELLG
jgi:hypothetical protein